MPGRLHRAHQGLAQALEPHGRQKEEARCHLGHEMAILDDAVEKIRADGQDDTQR